MDEILNILQIVAFFGCYALVWYLGYRLGAENGYHKGVDESFDEMEGVLQRLYDAISDDEKEEEEE